MEVWKKVSVNRDSITYDNYEVSSKGNVRNIKTGRLLKPIFFQKQYYYQLRSHGKPFMENAQKLVAREFLGVMDIKSITIKDPLVTPMSLNNMVVIDKKGRIYE